MTERARIPPAKAPEPEVSPKVSPKPCLWRQTQAETRLVLCGNNRQSKGDQTPVEYSLSTGGQEVAGSNPVVPTRFHKHKKFWCTKLGGKLHYLAKGRKNKDLAQEAFARLQQEVKLLGSSNHRSLTVAVLVEMYLEFAAENRKPATYEMHRWGLQPFVDTYAGMKAHALEIG